MNKATKLTSVRLIGLLERTWLMASDVLLVAGNQ